MSFSCNYGVSPHTVQQAEAAAIAGGTGRMCKTHPVNTTRRLHLLSRQAASLTSQNPIHCAPPDTPSLVPCLAAATCPKDPEPCPKIILTFVASPHSEIASRISLQYTRKCVPGRISYFARGSWGNTPHDKKNELVFKQFKLLAVMFLGVWVGLVHITTTI